MTRGRTSDQTIVRTLVTKLLGSYTAVMALLSLSAVGTALYLSPIASSAKPPHSSVAREAAATQGLPRHASKHTLLSVAPSEVTAQGRPSKVPEHTNTVIHDTEVIKIKEQPIIVNERSVAKAQPSSQTPTTYPPPTTTTTVDPTTTTFPSPTTTAPAHPTQSTYVVPTKAQLVDPGTDYWGVAINGVPQGTSQLNALDAEVGEAPSTLEWFQGWDEPYPTQAVQTSWQRGALPIITWESRPSNDTTPAISDPQYSLTNILNGNFNSYLQSFADGVVAQGLPVVIRFDQEMNGNWYPWSEGINNNPPGSFAATWKYVWNIFQAAGANQYVIWLWAPNRVDDEPASTPPLSHFYPGDQYVDWVGIDAYYRYISEAPTFAETFAESLSQLSALTSKPQIIAETGAIETNPQTGASNAANKAAWTTSLFAGVQADPQLIGFCWFDNVATTINDGVVEDNDWRLDSDPQTLLAFKTGLFAGLYTVGLMPPSSGQQPPTLEASPAVVTTTEPTDDDSR